MSAQYLVSVLVLPVLVLAVPLAAATQSVKPVGKPVLAAPKPDVLKDQVPESNVAGKKLIRVAQELSYHLCAQDVPGRVSAWQDAGYDGVCLTLFTRPAKNADGTLNQKNNMTFRWWDVSPRKYEEFAPEIAALKSINDWGRLTDNFLWMASHAEGTKPPDWFNDKDWEIVLSNTRLAARIAKEVGLKGLLFDWEGYGGGAHGVWRQPWDYPLYARGDYTITQEPKPRSFVEVAAKVRQRGRQWAEAMTSVYPEVVLFVIPGLYEGAWERSLQLGKNLDETDSGLVAPFIDGVLLGLGPKAILVSGNESTYLDSQYKEMLVWRDKCLNQALAVSTVPDLARKRITFSAGIWTDAGYGATGRFSDTDVTVNHRSPERHKHAVHNALAASDRYAWQWGEWGDHGESNFLTTNPTPLIREYWRANIEGHQPQDLLREPSPQADTTDYSQADANAAKGDADFWAGWEKPGRSVLAALPEFWKFRFDPEMKVRYSDWTTVECDDSSWFSIRTTQCWQSQGTRANGAGVYRVKFDVPAGFDPNTQEMLLAFGGLGGGAGHVYVNGGWIARLNPTVDVSTAIKPGTTNQVSIVCLNKQGPGGLMGQVKLLVRKKE